MNAPITNLCTKIASAELVSFWTDGENVFRVANDATSEIPDVYGYPQGKRWECTLAHWNAFRSVYSWAVDVAATEPEATQSN